MPAPINFTINIGATETWSADTTGSWESIKNPPDTYVPYGRTMRMEMSATAVPDFYRITSITGPSQIFENKTPGTGGAGYGQNDPYIIASYNAPTARIPHPLTTTSSVVIYWDNGDPPARGDAAPGHGLYPDPFVGAPIAADFALPEADSIALKWTPLETGGVNGDFYTYRIYYRVTGTGVWSVIDRNTSAIPGSTEPPSLLGNITQDRYTIKNLQALFAYDYYLTALDVFGNETLLDNRAYLDKSPDGKWGIITTKPASYSVKITDGLKTCENALFATTDPATDPDPTSRQLQATAIRVEIEIKGAPQPDELNIVLKDATTTPIGPGNIVSGGVPIGTFYEIPATKIAPNKWQAFFSNHKDSPESELIKSGKTCQFILEAVAKGKNIFIDWDSYDQGKTPNFDDDHPWVFSIVQPPNFKPYPTRVLNNVITDKNPAAYPSYYLTDDAYVTITAYDIKGRSVAVLLDKAPRPKGQNIKENGWRGTNRAGKKLGVGLYYVHIKAVRRSDGKVLIDKFNKVVMAR
jgi:hypothetical protein